jgi:hypothetical protein
VLALLAAHHIFHISRIKVNNSRGSVCLIPVEISTILTGHLISGSTNCVPLMRIRRVQKKSRYTKEFCIKVHLQYSHVEVNVQAIVFTVVL